MKRDRLNIAIIGAGDRALQGYCIHFQGFTPAPRFVAIAEPNPVALQRTLDTLKLQPADVRVYTSWEQLLDKEHALDAAIVGTPNHLHHGPAMVLLQRGVPIVLEKPLAISPDQCLAIHQAASANRVPVQLGFVLRSAPFYMKIKSLVDADAIGQIISIQADELVGWVVTSMMMRGRWRQHQRLSGGSMLEKCCHDMDLLNWMAASRPVAVHSFGGRRIFTPNPSVGTHCTDCVAKDTCTYGYDAIPRDDRRLRECVYDVNACVYNRSGDMVDHQSVQLLYENGTIANFMLTFNAWGPHSNRNMHLVGAHGRIWGNLNDSKVYHFDNRTNQVHEHPIVMDGSGHGGGDRPHATAFLETVVGRRARSAADTWDGYLSAMVCFAADRSMTEGRRVHLQYSAEDKIQIV